MEPFGILAYIGPGAGFAFLGSFFLILLALFLAAISLLAWPLRSLYHILWRSRGARKGKVHRVIIVGLDGLDYERTRRLLDEGRLPNLKRLAERGHFGPLQTTTPPLSPVAWSSFMTGVNPGKHNIFDFLNRDTRTYLPELSSSKVIHPEGNGQPPFFRRAKPVIKQLRKGIPFWHILGQYHVFSTIIRVPVTFPPEPFRGLLLAGMCVPDIRGTQGSYTLFSTELSEPRQTTGGLHIPIKVERGRASARLPGPIIPGKNGRRTSSVQIDIRVLPGDPGVSIRVAGGSFRLALREYSEWVRIPFPVGPLKKAWAACRFYLRSISPSLQLYVTPLNLDAESPAMPISHPGYYAIYLAKLHGPFATLGLAEDTQALDEGVIPEKAFIEQVYAIHDERERMFFDALARTRRGLCACVFDASDRIQHMFLPPGNGANGETSDTARYNCIVDEMYARMDNLVGRVMDQAGEKSVVIVLSDHGFVPFRRQFHLNAWLRENGYLFTRQGGNDADYLRNVDWSRTRAYALGMSGIYVNQKGREARGIVEPGNQSRELKAELITKLRQLKDPGNRGAAPVQAVYDASEIYSGPFRENGPDLVVGYSAGYRVSWNTVIGRADGPVFADNDKAWGADHCVDPSLVPGVLFCNRPINEPSPSIMDVGPTVLDLFNIPPPAQTDGRPWKVDV